MIQDHDHVMETKWYPYRGLPKAKQWRKCVLPDCHYFETRDA